MADPDIKSMTFPQLCEAIAALGEREYRAKQIFDWIHVKGIADYDEMSNLPKILRDTSRKRYPLPLCEIINKQVSKVDGTIKYLFKLSDGESIESVSMSYKYGSTLCVSSQAGCKLGCVFCATGAGGFSRNLAPSEMLGQIHAAQKDTEEKVSRVVLMGMGEPLDNFDNVVRFIELMADSGGLNIGMRNISLSTCGIVPGIYRLLEKRIPLTLSVSLHAPNDQIRDILMPVNKRYPIDSLLEACAKYARITSRRISFEYALFKGVNDSEDCAKQLSGILKGMLCHVNLIPCSKVSGSIYTGSSREVIERFSSVLNKSGITATIRRSLGKDIDAACGQLRGRITESLKNP